MKYNEIGKSGVSVSEISFGAGPAGGLMVNGEIAEQVRAVRTALDAGINHFDTAAFYGYGASEIYLGQALREARAKDVLITSKVPISPEFMAMGDLRRCVRQSVEQSLSRLRVDCIDTLLLHNATHRTHQPYDPAREGEMVAVRMNTYIPPATFDDLVGERGVIEEVEVLIEEGKIRRFGLSGQDNDPTIVRAMIATGKIAIFNQTYNLLNPSAGFPQARRGRRIEGEFARAQRELFIEFDNVIDTARAANVGVSVISPLAAGVLCESALAGEAPPSLSRLKVRFPFDGQRDRQVELARLFAPVARQAGIPLQELALRFVLNTPGVTTLVSGFSSSEQVSDVVKAAGKPPLGEDVLTALQGVWFGQGTNSSLAPRPVAGGARG